MISGLEFLANEAPKHWPDESRTATTQRVAASVSPCLKESARLIAVAARDAGGHLAWPRGALAAHWRAKERPVDLWNVSEEARGRF